MNIPLHQDYIDFISLLNRHRCAYAVIGSYAMAHYGYQRMSGNFDILIEQNEKNVNSVYKALQDFGAPLRGLAVEEMLEPGFIFQIGVAPVRIDMYTSIDGVETTDAVAEAVREKIAGRQMPFLSLQNIIKSKSSTGRPRDLEDVKELNRIMQEDVEHQT